MRIFVRPALRRGAAFALAAAACVALTGAYMPGEPPPRPNLLINPTAAIDQANEGNAITSSAGVLNAYAVDGFRVWLNSTAATKAVVSCQRTSDAPAGYTYSLKCAVTTGASSVGAGDYLAIAIPIEAATLQDALLGTAGAQSLCRQWQVKSSIASYTYGWALQNFAQTRSLPNAEAIASAAAWTPVSSCFTGDTAGTWVTSGNAGGAYLIVTVAAGSTYQGAAGSWTGANDYGTSALTNSILTTTGATFEIANAKLEVSPVVTPFLQLLAQQELARCQRYYEKSYDLGVLPGTALGRTGQEFFGYWGASTATYSFGVRYKTPKRAAPVVTLYSPTTGSSGAVDNGATADVTASAAQIGLEGFQAGTVSFTPSGIGNGLRIQWTADSRL